MSKSKNARASTTEKSFKVTTNKKESKAQIEITPGSLWWMFGHGSRLRGHGFSMRNYGRSVHFAGAAFFLFIFLEYKNEPTPFDLGPLGKWKYFPQWNLVSLMCLEKLLLLLLFDIKPGILVII